MNTNEENFCQEDTEPMMPKVKHFIDKVASLIQIET